MKETEENYIRRKCLERLKDNPEAGVMDFQEGIYAGIQYDKNKYSEEDMRKAYSRGWITRERFDNLSPDIIYPKGLDYEEKQDYAFNLWFEKFKKK